MIAHVDTSNHTPVVHEAKSETPARGQAPAPRYPARPLPVEPDEPAAAPLFLNRHGRRAQAALMRKHVTKLRLAERAAFLKKLKTHKEQL